MRIHPAGCEPEIQRPAALPTELLDHGAQKAPNSASYSLINGLSGSTGNGNTAGVDDTAPNQNTNGKLLGFGQFNSATPPILGAVALAPITVAGNSSNSTNSTGCTGTCGGNPGNSQWCTIGSELSNVFTGYKGWVTIMCGPSANVSCTGVSWTTTGASHSGDTTSGTYVTVTAGPGATGRVSASVDSNPNHNCYFDFLVGERACWQIS